MPVPDSALAEISTTNMDQALRYAAECGWHVFPVVPGSKKPYAGSAGVKDATTDPAAIMQAWQAHPEANIGVACGPSGLVVVDVDLKSGGPVSVAELEGKHGKLPETVEAFTPSGGMHLAYRAPAGDRITNAVGRWPGVDIRADGGYFVVSPSVHPNGGHYTWRSGRSPLDREPAELPAFLREALVRGAPPVAAAAKITEGQRNDWLARQAGALRRVGDDAATIATALLALNRTECDPPLAESEVRRIAASIASRPAPEARAVRILTRAALRDVPPLEWLIEGVLPAGGMVVLYGPSGGGKTFATMSMGYAISAGIDWLGRQTKQGPVVYVAAEGASGFNVRVEALEAVHGLPADSFFTVPEAINLTNGAEVDALIEQVLALLDKPKLLVFDTLARCLVGGDENNPRDMGLLVAGADRIRKALGCAVLIVHHCGKSKGATYRGHSALVGAADAVIRFGADGAFLKMECDKMKDGPSFDRINALLRSAAESCIVELSDATSHPKAKSVQVALAALEEHFGTDWTPLAEWRNAVEMPSATFAKAIKTAALAGYVERRGDGRGQEYRLSLFRGDKQGQTTG